MHAEQILVQTKQLLQSFLFPSNPKCAVCSKVLFTGNMPFCKTCKTALTEIQTIPHCDKCGNPLPKDSKACTRCPRLPDIVCGISLYLYNETCRKIVHDFKYRHNPNGAYSCGILLAEQLLKQPWFWQIDQLIPVPTNETTLLSRGYNQSERITDAIADKCDIIINNHILSKMTDARDQTELDQKERLSNALQSYTINPDVTCTGKTVLLIDDIITTGATVSALSRLLMQAGAKKIYFATVATASEDN